MKILLLGLPTGAFVLLAQEAPDPSSFAAYGIAAPFAALCLWLLIRAYKKIDDLERKVDALNAAALQREQEYLARLAPMLYDGALLYREGNREAAKAGELDAVAKKVVDLLKQMGGGEGTGDAS